MPLTSLQWTGWKELSKTKRRDQLTTHTAFVVELAIYDRVGSTREVLVVVPSPETRLLFFLALPLLEFSSEPRPDLAFSLLLSDSLLVMEDLAEVGSGVGIRRVGSDVGVRSDIRCIEGDILVMG